MKLDFCSLSSGSSGNCYYLGNEFHGILIDAGISGTAIRKSLRNMGVSMQTIRGVLVTHNHSDHIRGVEQLSRKNFLPVFTTQNVLKSFHSQAAKISVEGFREIVLQQKFHLAGFDIEAFPVFHDAPETIGFHISYGDKKITIVTDLGHICETAAPYIKAANLLVIESNYDEQMLENGTYPPYLKKRIRSDHGHLGNHQTSAFLADNMGDHLSHICLAHLSKNNNTPELALQTLHKTFSERGVNLNGKQKITVLNRNLPSEMISLMD
ncbi:MAG: MBL fold metallo-hydrolase [Bacteroidales bacterium]|nr:MBL fold metallo-hydrolase [Bacteroidales bacterium]MCB8999204.1 MBL fold metallo-hydrolase [Bacteroidales bacterium]